MIQGATGSAYTVAQASVAESGTAYSVRIVDGSGSVTSAAAMLNVTALTPQLSFSQIAAQVFGNPAVSVNAASASSGVVTYSVVSGPATVAGNMVTLTGAGTVLLSASQAASGNYGVATATTTFQVAPETPSLRFATIAATTYGAAPVTVSASSVSNGAITFAVVSGPATLTGNTLAPSGAGTVVISASQAASGNYGAATTTASVTVAPATPSLSFAPIGPTTYGAASFSVSASSVSTGAVTYAVVSGPATISGSTLTLTGGGNVVISASQAAAGNYAATTATTSFAVGLNVALSAITPSAQTIAPGQQAFTARATGGPTNELTWSASGGSITPLGVWTSPSAAGTYTITATSTDDPTKSVSTAMTVSAPVISAQPAGGSVCPSAALTLSATAQYASTYQWFLNGTALAGAAGSSYSLVSAQTSDAGTYTVAVSNAAGTVISHVATVAVGSSITTNPQGATVLQPASATFSVAAQGQSPFTYQWYSVSPQATAGVAIAGATGASFTTPATSSSGNGTGYYAVVSDACRTQLTSTSAILAVNSAPVIAQQPVSQPLVTGDTAPFSVAVTGTPSLSYQWYMVPAGLQKGTAIPGATAPSYTVPATATTASNNGDGYFVAVSNAYGNVTSQTAQLQGPATTSSWVVGWGASPENAVAGSENPGGNEQSFRNFFYPTVAGSVERVHLSNLFGKTPITVGAARLAAASSTNGVSGDAIDTTRDVPLSFQGSSTITLQPGQEVVSDPVQITYSYGQKLAVSLYVQGTFPALTQHESQVNVNYATPVGAGNATADASGASFSQSNTEWFVLTGVDVYGPYQGTVAVFGSSSIDGHASNYSDTYSYPVSNVPVAGQDNDRPSDWLARQLMAAGYNLGVLNAGTIGDPAGEDSRTATGAVVAGIDRFQHDVLQQPGIKAVVVYIGGIDLRGDCIAATNVEASLANIVSQAYAAGVRVILATLPPSEYCTSVQPLPSAAAPYYGDINPGPENPGSTQRNLLNAWIGSTGATLPGVVAIADFDAALLDPQHPDFMQPNLNSGDNFHPNGTGYEVQSSAIPLGSLLAP